MKKMKKIKIVAYVLMAISIFIPLVYWGLNPELTEMQIFLKFWYIYATILLVAIISIFKEIRND